MPVDTKKDQVKLLILCILKRTWGWYKAMMSSQSHQIYALLINKCAFFGFYIKIGALKDLKKEEV